MLRPPASPRARRKQQVLGSLVLVACGLDVATMLYARSHTGILVPVMFGISAGLLLLAVIYILKNRRST